MKRITARSIRNSLAGMISTVTLLLCLGTDAQAAGSRVEDGDISIVYGGIWYTASSSELSGGSGHESNTVGSTASLVFTGTGVTWISYTCACEAGISNVYIDGKFAASVDTYSPTPQAQVPVFTASNLTPGVHILTIEVTGKFDPRGQTAYVMIDAFDVVD
ncbi:MAG: hypothetical protein ACM3ZT_02080 [Bacillota bacterium]